MPTRHYMTHTYTVGLATNKNLPMAVQVPSLAFLSPMMYPSTYRPSIVSLRLITHRPSPNPLPSRWPDFTLCHHFHSKADGWWWWWYLVYSAQKTQFIEFLYFSFSLSAVGALLTHHHLAGALYTNLVFGLHWYIINIRGGLARLTPVYC